MALKNQVPNVYSVGLQNAGSYLVSGQPFIARRSVNAGDEIKIEFPFVTKNVIIRIPPSPNTCTQVIQTSEAYWWGYQSSGGGLNDGPLIPYFGSGSLTADTNPTVEGERDYTYSIWFKWPNSSKAAYPINFYGTGNNLSLKSPDPYDATKILLQLGRANLNPITGGNVEFAATVTVPDVRTNWGHLLVTQHTGSTNLYINGERLATTSEMIGICYNVIKGLNSGARTPGDVLYDEEMMWNTGMTSDQVLEVYNNGEWHNPNIGSLSDNLVGWWTYGDYHTDRYAPGLTAAYEPNIFKNAATGTSRSGSAMTSLCRWGGGTEDAYYVPGPFTSQTKGALRVSLLSTGSTSGANIVSKNHYRELQGYGTSIELPMKAKEIYFQGVKSQVTFEVIAELTNIPIGRMYELTGSGIDE